MPPSHLDDHALAGWLAQLIRIPSVAPEYAGTRSGEPGEGRLAAAISTWFRQFGGEVHVHEVLPRRPNVYGIWRGTTDRWLGVDVHTDTVGVEHMTGDPFAGHVTAGRVYGRGAVDTKATLGVVLGLLEALHETKQPLAANLLIAATADEEVGATGAPACAGWLHRQGITIDQLIVAEPTRCRPIHGHKGVCRLTFEVRGRSAHSAQPDLGQNAVTAAAHLVLAMAAEHRRLQHIDSPLGTPALTVSLIKGGVGINVVPDCCRVSIDRRLVVGEKATEVADALQALAEASCPLPISTERCLSLDPFYQPPDTPWLHQLAAWSGQAPAVAPYGTNAWAYAGVAKECVVLGPGSIEQAHGPEEWVSLGELEKLAGIYARWWGIDLAPHLS